VKRAIAMAAEHNGRIDILCNNAAYIALDFHAALESTDTEWRKCIDVALMGTHDFIKAALPHVIVQKQGSIVNVVSIQAMEGMMSSVAYTATKACAP
jgi:NAD(P)-dependent dehydrogenase (short-subunit alcohol dehydrogenase family)